MSLVMLFGPPAVGKMAVGMALRDATGFRLFHNHLSIEAVLPIFPFDSPPFARVVKSFREEVFREAANSDLPGLIFTFVWAFNHDGNRVAVQETVDVFAEAGREAFFVELQADLEVRLARNRTQLRLAEKPSKRDVAASERRLIESGERHQLHSSVPFPFANHFRIDNSALGPEDVAQRIVTHFGFPRSHSSMAQSGPGDG